MTRPHKQSVQCQHCGGFTSTNSPFGSWLRAQPEIDSRAEGVYIFDIDWIIHRCRKGADKCGTREVECLMLIETKCYDTRLEHSQRDTLNILGQLLNNTRNNKFIQARGAVRQVFSTYKNKVVPVRCFGVHTLTFKKTCPDDGYMKWDKKGEITKEQLIGLLRFEIHPYTLQPMDIRRHHTPALFEDSNGSLFT